jgi:hypothetical protein
MTFDALHTVRAKLDELVTQKYTARVSFCRRSIRSRG